eukprot:m.99051 g.99051  ORF g.99051 m.99051 type:complete len:169 (+) comp14888_c2_seq1:1892-2398(+)
MKGDSFSYYVALISNTGVTASANFPFLCVLCYIFLALSGGHRASFRSASSTSLASAFSEANGGVIVDGKGLNLDHIATLDVHEQVATLRKLVLTMADERDTALQRVETLEKSQQELVESNIQLRRDIGQLTRSLRESKESFDRCYAENVRLARKVADLELELNMPAEV